MKVRSDYKDAGALYARACMPKLHIATIKTRYTLTRIACHTRASSTLVVEGSYVQYARCSRLDVETRACISYGSARPLT